MPAELHVTSLAVHARPQRLAAVAEAIRALPGAELHASSPQGKLVVTLETPGEGEVLARLEVIRALEGVLSAHLVYHGILEGPAEESEP
jgi:nitrate reductase NapD